MTGPGGVWRPKQGRLRIDQLRAPLGRIAGLALFQDGGPHLRGDAQEAQREIEILRIFAIDEIGQPRDGDILEGEIIHQRFEIRRERHGIGGRGRDQEITRRIAAHSIAVFPLRNGCGRRPGSARRAAGGAPAGRWAGAISASGSAVREQACGEFELRIIGLAQRHECAATAPHPPSSNCESRVASARAARCVGR